MYSFRNGLIHRKIDLTSVSFKNLQAWFTPVPSNSLRALLIKMGPFDAEVHGFHFGNQWTFTEQDATEIQRRFEAGVDGSVDSILSVVRNALTEIDIIGEDTGIFKIPEYVINNVIIDVKIPLIDKLLGIIIGNIPGAYGRCGGMAFAGFDFYLVGWPVDARFGTMPPLAGDLRDYIWKRLLDSLELNVGKFLEYIAILHILPVISKLATSVLLAQAGSIGGSVGTAIGAFIGFQLDILHLGGAGQLLDSSKQEWLKLKTKLDYEAAWPIGLVYADSALPTDQHQVLATGYTDFGNGTAILRVWDNNHKNKNLDWPIDFRSGELQVTGPSHPMKGLIFEEYSPVIPPLSLKLS